MYVPDELLQPPMYTTAPRTSTSLRSHTKSLSLRWRLAASPCHQAVHQFS